MDFEKVKKDWWVFFDWKEDLYKEVPLQGVSIFALKESYKLAQLLGKEKEVADLPQLTDKMIKAARKTYTTGKPAFSSEQATSRFPMLHKYG